jgi:glycosyltransferase involved in cell wall biosynthesis
MIRSVLFLNDNPLPDTFTQGTITAKELRLRAALEGIDTVHVIAPKGPYVSSHIQTQTALEEKIIVHHCFSFPYYGRGLSLFLHGLLLALKIKPLTIEAESPHISGPAAIIIGRLLGIPSIIEVRATLSALLHHRLKWLPLRLKQYALYLVQDWSYHHATRIIANSFTYQKRLAHLGYQSTVINPGLQPRRFTAKKATLPKNTHGYVIGYLGRLVPEKGIDVFIKAIDLLSQNHTLPPFFIEIAGAGPEKSKLAKLVESLQLEHLVNFLGQVDNVTVLSHWDLLVNPCLVNAPIEMVNAEAAALGVPVICFGNEVYPETVAHNQTGLKVLPKTPAVLAQAIAHLLNHPEEIKNFSRKGPVFAKKFYSFSSQTLALKNLYHELGLID